MVKEAIRLHRESGRDESGTEIDGHTVLVSTNGDTPAGLYGVGIYLPGSTPEGECDGYYTCDENGEAE